MSTLSSQAIIDSIANAKKTTPVTVYLKGDLADIIFPDTVHVFLETHTGTVIGDWALIEPVLTAHADQISDQVVKTDGRNTGVPLLDIKPVNARIEPGAIIRNPVTIGNQAVIMMGAIINIGVEIGDKTMIDMGVVLGGRVQVGARCHIGAGTVLAGVVEPPSATPVVIDDDVVVGANAVVLEGIHVGQGAVVAAGAVVTEDVPAHTVVAGVPARVIKAVNAKTSAKTELVDDLRKL
ncbi:2,3,4,5-tetrahydropyridine-2,6-dicarboxylate N-acetyltransferase [Lacticaseibacillus saniviri]|uniref:2,3,4,5-tetrahydropyridine-2,6-dicarboxylate N-acetyltransferase n=1 Tax=Lacticaseibacillus saniviri JCM 17471 = DSM 24301 TaxID=1293598 RepID=A0A0R2MSD5_9LACO|nr:2,3,4,5-tetrahydropyridine-2,6-dicarboxylate N-acetyltransferase [Lacticaseibacillus saniviri]KRO16469.1 2,3,4,5-tetrahydropyridine-2-carboxylate N-succinyltransferase [Lacticaseibacillus saniviri JCM 17471 = DSM 24301]MCG4282005.1 2,3,4,5-tetrahydropyridine-2,6-dicarboxylate N-acetyltransferase [Lacticaseibacillus saniviri]